LSSDLAEVADREFMRRVRVHIDERPDLVSPLRNSFGNCLSISFTEERH
jgi:hypothetical protein